MIAFTAAGVVAFAELYGVQALLPALARDLEVTPADAALVQSAGAFGLAAAVLPWSMAARRFGTGRMLRLAIAGSVLLGPVVALLGSLELLIAARFAQGALLAGIPALALTHLAELLDRRSAVQAAGWYVAGTSVGGLLGRLVAGFAGELADWRAGLAAVSLLSLLAALAFFLLTPRAPAGLLTAPGTGDASRASWHPRIWQLCAAALLAMGGFVALYNYFGFRLVGPDFRLPDIAVSLIFVTYLFGTVAAASAGRAVNRRGRRRVLAVGIAAQLTGSLLTLPSVLPIALVGLALATAGFFAVHAVAAGWVAELGRGSAGPSAAYTLAYYLGAGGIGWLGGFVYAAVGWPGTVAAIAACVLIAAALIVTASRHEPGTPVDAP